MMRIGMTAAPMMLIALAGCSSTPPCEDKVEAYIISQQFVTERLKAPSSATFGSITDSSTVIWPTQVNGKCAFDISANVDAQNSFGAQLRQRYHATVAPDGQGSWDLIRLDIT